MSTSYEGGRVTEEQWKQLRELEERLLAIEQRIDALADAARYRYIRDAIKRGDRVKVQALLWNASSRDDFDQQVDKARHEPT